MISTSDSIKKNVNQLMMKLERNQSIVFQYLKQLNSYRCEPTDYQCFLQVGRLKQGLKELAAEQQELMTKTNRSAKGDDKLLQTIEHLFERFQQLESDIAQYLREIKNHY
ncbi:hypothetical protein [Flagellimonas lutaonensis]|uniref:Uncharacterized protein n=1 Tax=Flagellimonas lutaonensis TaxID=516051 RepID=A0A0D5YVP5_9FLAO|nr:hypothetical protein [Allomuricauda lutaonensis]AKA36387.1 hypothetical protein VC82_2841 [Allomuricauda lutaonensis]